MQFEWLNFINSPIGMDSNYSALLLKLDAFIRKHYKNLLLRGSVYFTLMLLFGFLFIITLEYFGNYTPIIRGTLFYSYIVFALLLFYRFMAKPLLGLYKLGKTLNYQEASAIIGKHFPEVSDKLLNTLQLYQNTTQNDLLHAAIHQKSASINQVNFTDAVDMKRNFRFARLILVPTLVYAILYLLAPGVISKGSERIIKYNQTFIPEAPFSFVVDERKLKTEQYADLDIALKINGQTLPDMVEIETDGNLFLMQKKDNQTFNYTIHNIAKPGLIRFKAAGFFSGWYKINLQQAPILVDYTVKIEYPTYLHKSQSYLANPSDLNVPEGSKVTWKLNTKQTQSVWFTIGKTNQPAQNTGDGIFTFSEKVTETEMCVIKTSSPHQLTDSLAYQIMVVKDAFPQITLDQKTDSISGLQQFFIGDIEDDYAITKLTFNYQVVRNGKKDKAMQLLVPIQPNEKAQRFYYQFDIAQLGLSPEDEVTYYFEVWDNDGVNGKKSTKSKWFDYKTPSVNEQINEMNQAGKNMQSDMKNIMQQSKQLQKELKELQLKMTDKRDLTWEEKKKLEDLIKREKELLKKLEEVKKQNEVNNQKQNQLQPPNEEMLEKQKQIEKLFNELMDDEMKKLLKEMEKLLQQQNKDALKQDMEKMQLSNKEVEKELDRMLEQFKQLELDKKLQLSTEQLEKLAEKQKELMEKCNATENAPKPTKQQKQEQLNQQKHEQQKINEQFKDIENQLKEIKEENQKQEDPKELENTEKLENEIKEHQQNATDKLEQQKSKEAQEEQKNAADKMQEMAKKIKEKQAKNEEEEHEENAETLREILENTIQLSKDQEDLILQMRNITGYNPQYVELAKKQKITKDNAQIIEDSLWALAKRVPEINAYITKELTALNNHLDKSIQAYAQRNFGEIRTRQQFAMTNANNLANLLSEVLNQMQQQAMQSKSKSKGKGKGKPSQGSGSGKPLSMKELKKRQEELNKQLREGMNKPGDQGKPDQGKGQKPGDKPNGQTPGGQQGQGMSSEQFARMAAEQMAIRQQMQKMMQQMDAKQKEGLGGQKQLDEMRKLMEQTEKELYNKKLTTEMLNRQQEILTRLLESEKAERKQEQEQKREAEQAKEKVKPNPPQFNQYIEQKNKQKELLQTIPVEMQPYYKEKSKQYLNQVGAE